MRKFLFLLALFPYSAAFAASSSYTSPASLPSLISQDGTYATRHNPEFGEWNILAGSHYASLNWKRNTSAPLGLYITPSSQMISIDVIAKKNEYREFKLPFITWNIKDISVTLNKTRDADGWVTYSTAIYTQNIDRLVKALEQDTPMTLNLSVLTSIPVNLHGLQPALSQFRALIQRQHLQAPAPLGIPVEENTSLAPPEGMVPSDVPLYQQSQYYVAECMKLSSQPLEHSLRYDMCMKRNDYLKKMENQGWCWGSGDPDQHDKDKVWRKCIMSPKGGVPKVQNKVKQDLEKAEAVSKG